ncbi:MAG TPA: flagellar hook protein FlgE [Acidimicrobiales bacterium]|nr:flagellar hook protein FlgE [Acidimicrobiales bacterium]
MLRSLFSGVSGLDANQEYIDSIGNDISNLNTTGYKSNEVQFEDLLGQTLAGATAPSTTVGGINPTQVGLGVKVAGIESNFTQGTSEQTGNPLDLSIQGDGFFIANDGSQSYYTRAGSLQVDGAGHLVTPNGYLVQGWPASASGTINSSAPLGPLSIPSGQQIAANATQTVTLGGNLAAQSGWTPPTGLPGSSSGSGSTAPVGASTSVTVYAANGSTQTLDLAFEPASSLPAGAPTGATSAWNVYGALASAGTAPNFTGATPATLYFNQNGTLVGSTSLSLTVPPPTGSTGGTSTKYTLSVPTVTANASDDTVSVLSQDGNAPGTLQSFSIQNTGMITGVFSNGQTLNLGQIALATFANPNGLMRAGNTAFMATANSGLAQIGAPGNGSRGTLQAGTLEASNVDLATEMTQLIEAERGFQANGSIITTSDTLLQDLINLKQGG